MISSNPLAITIFVVAVIGTTGNIATVFIFLRSRSLRKPINFFLVVLAFTDCICLLLPGASQLEVVNSRLKDPALCTASALVYAGGCHYSVNCIAFTAVIRYVHIVRPDLSQKISPWKFCTWSLLTVTLEASVFLTLPATGVVKLSFFESLGFCLIDFTSSWLFAVGVFLTAFVIPVTAIVYSYAQILMAHLKSKRRVASNDPSTTEQRQTLKKTEIKMLLQVLIIFGFFSFTFGPSLLLLAVLDAHQTKYTTLFQYMTLSVAVNSSINPVIYFVFNNAYKQEVLKWWPCRKARTTPGTSVDTVSHHVSGHRGRVLDHPGTSRRQTHNVLNSLQPH